MNDINGILNLNITSINDSIINDTIEISGRVTIDLLPNSDVNSSYFIPSIIALATVVISAYTSYLIAKKQIKNSKENQSEQIGAQLAIAQDQLIVSKQQIDQTAKNTLEQVRANNISNARITWLNELRKLLVEFLSSCTVYLECILSENKYKALDEKVPVDLLREIDKAKDDSRKYLASILLFLNPEDKLHKELELLLLEFLRNDTEPNKDIYGELLERIITKARELLKETWEQAKNETIK